MKADMPTAAEPTEGGRRHFLKSAGGLTLTALALGAVSAPSGWAAEPSHSESGDIRILNVALGLEHEAIAAYGVAAHSGLLKPGVRKVALAFQGQHKAHADVLASTVHKLGGQPVAARSVKAY
ncbi:MAG TPA: ferritin-like domain-containing protein, partial [Acidiferrobacteraceae bacterium]|nr:ferritin-like domain-containing protein [Acidiferrobacteraceae bacterium]